MHYRKEKTKGNLSGPAAGAGTGIIIPGLPGSVELPPNVRRTSEPRFVKKSPGIFSSDRVSDDPPPEALLHPLAENTGPKATAGPVSTIRALPAGIAGGPKVRSLPYRTRGREADTRTRPAQSPGKMNSCELIYNLRPHISQGKTILFTTVMRKRERGRHRGDARGSSSRSCSQHSSSYSRPR